jgi:cobalamin-dependent methionine synthase I
MIDYKPIQGLTLIGESINDSVPSTKQLLDNNDIGGLQDLAVKQAQSGAAYLDVNVGMREPEFMKGLVQALQNVVAVPLCLDSPNPKILQAALQVYNPEKAGGKKPIINSMTELRPEILDFLKIQPFKLILLCTERKQGEDQVPNHTAREIHDTAVRLQKIACSAPCNISNDDLIIDPGIAPIASDFEGTTRTTLDAIRLIHGNPDLKGIHMSVGLSNFSIMLPSKRASGGLVKTPLESAFITLAMTSGLDMIIGSVKKKYRLLDKNDDARKTLEEMLKLDAFEAIERLQAFYNS